ncbi:MAG: aminotransferase class V-fold PLP-dependent enzyme [Patescibacteria group bacterium]
MIDVKKIREDFPIFKNEPNLVYFDNACMALRPRQVIEAMNEYYEKYPACAGRSGHRLGETVTKKVDEARQTVADFIGAKKEEIIFTKNATEAINLVAQSLNFEKGDIVLGGNKEHNSNLLPWLFLERQKEIIYKVLPEDYELAVPEGVLFNIEKYHPKLVSMGLTSNLDGMTINAKKIIEVAHKNGSMVLLDAAQAVPHQKINVKELDVDFLVFSGHKMLGPSGTGVLYGKKKLLERLAPFMLGGGTVSSSSYDSFQLLPIPDRFEAGLQNYAGIIGLGEAVKYLEGIGFNYIKREEDKLNTIIIQGLYDIFPKEALLGYNNPIVKHNGIVTFYTKKMPSHQIMLLLDKAGIAVRSGQFCVHSWFNANKIKDAVRASVYFYNTEEEAERFVEEMKKIAKAF